MMTMLSLQSRVGQIDNVTASLASRFAAIFWSINEHDTLSHDLSLESK